MARTPETFSINLQELMLLLNYRWAAVQSENVGELGIKSHEDFLREIDGQTQIDLRPDQLADLVHHMKEVCFSNEEPAPLKFTIKNHNEIMRKLKRQIPHMFKETAAGEVVMVNYEDRFDEPR